MFKKEKGMMFVLSSPSGVGKTTLTKKIEKNNPNFKISISHTTRKPRPNEIDGKDYYFVDTDKFNLLVKNEDFFEHAKIFDNYYGTRKDSVLKFLSNGNDILFDINWQGTQQLKKNRDLPLVTFFVLPPNIEILKQRLLNRHSGQEKIIEQRMNMFVEEISHWNEYNYIVVNDDLEECYNNLLGIINSEKQGIKKNQDISMIEKKIKELLK